MRSLILICTTALLSSCSSIISDSSQPFTIDTGEVKGATCRMTNGSGEYIMGSSPGTVTIDNACGEMQVVCKKEGYKTKSVQVDYSHKGSTVGNIILGGGVGYLVDRGTGAACKYPPSVFISMDKEQLDLPLTTGTLPIDEWTRYLEQGDEQLAGSGWGSIEVRGIEYVPASLLPQ